MGWLSRLTSRGISRGESARANAGSRAAITVHVDVAACIRWFGISLALVLLSWSLSEEQAALVLRTALERQMSLISPALDENRASSSGRTLPGVEVSDCALQDCRSIHVPHFPDWHLSWQEVTFGVA